MRFIIFRSITQQILIMDIIELQEDVLIPDLHFVTLPRQRKKLVKQGRAERIPKNRNVDTVNARKVK